MPEQFNARREATKIEKMELPLEIPQYPIEKADMQAKLRKELDSLTPEQMRAVGLLVEKDTPRSYSMSGYVNDVIMDSDNNVTGFIFNRPSTTVRVERSSDSK
jgi:hypothetical protein